MLGNASRLLCAEAAMQAAEVVPNGPVTTRSSDQPSERRGEAASGGSAAVVAAFQEHKGPKGRSWSVGDPRENAIMAADDVTKTKSKLGGVFALLGTGTSANAAAYWTRVALETN